MKQVVKDLLYSAKNADNTSNSRDIGTFISAAYLAGIAFGLPELAYGDKDEDDEISIPEEAATEEPAQTEPERTIPSDPTQEPGAPSNVPQTALPVKSPAKPPAIPPTDGTVVGPGAAVVGTVVTSSIAVSMLLLVYFRHFGGAAFGRFAVQYDDDYVAAVDQMAEEVSKTPKKEEKKEKDEDPEYPLPGEEPAQSPSDPFKKQKPLPIGGEKSGLLVTVPLKSERKKKKTKPRLSFIQSIAQVLEQDIGKIITAIDDIMEDINSERVSNNMQRIDFIDIYDIITKLIKYTSGQTNVPPTALELSVLAYAIRTRVIHGYTTIKIMNILKQNPEIDVLDDKGNLNIIAALKKNIFVVMGPRIQGSTVNTILNDLTDSSNEGQIIRHLEKMLHGSLMHIIALYKIQKKNNQNTTKIREILYQVINLIRTGKLTKYIKVTFMKDVLEIIIVQVKYYDGEQEANEVKKMFKILKKPRPDTVALRLQLKRQQNEAFNKLINEYSDFLLDD